MNKILLEYYGTNFDCGYLLDAKDEFNSNIITEVDYRNIEEIIKVTDGYIKESYKIDGELNIFTEYQIKEFIKQVANDFIESYYPLFGNLIEVNCKRKRSLG